MTDKRYSYPIDRAVPSVGVVPIRDLENSNVLHPVELGYYDEPDDRGIDFWTILRILIQRKWMIASLTVLGAMIAFMLTMRVTPMYAATATIEILPEEVQIIEGTSVSPEIVADTPYMETQYRLLRSRFLAERVAEELNLSNDRRYSNPAAPRDVRTLQAARTIVGGLRIFPSGRSRVVNVRYASPHPQEAARIANAIVEGFIQSNLERKYNTTAFAREFIDERLVSTKRALEDSEREFVEYAEEQGLLDIGRANSGQGVISLDESSILSLNGELSEAESARISAEQEYRTAIDTPPVRALLESAELITLRQIRSQLLSDYDEKLGQFKPDYPDMVQLRARIDRVGEEIETESKSIVDSVLSELRMKYDAAVAREESLKIRVDELRNNLLNERDRRIQYRILQREVETLRSQYEALLQRSKEVSISSGIGSSNISIVDTALVPFRPFEPNLRRALIQGIFLSFVLGVGLAFALNYIDDTIKSPDDVRTKLGLPTIGVVPKLIGKSARIKDELDNPKSPVAEAFESARTALEFATEAGTPRSILITSTRPGEGKTSTTIALATVFARGGKRVLIVDGDMRKPSFILDSSRSIGLSGLLTGSDLLMDHVIKTKTDGLSVLPAGVIPPNPAQLLAGNRLKEIIGSAESMFDIVLVDSPPILSFADSPRLGSVVQGAILVIQSGLVRTPAARRTIAQLNSSRTNILGGILTKFDAKKAGYGYSYYYAGYNRGAYAYIDSSNTPNAHRKVLIEASDDETDKNESERWA